MSGAGRSKSMSTENLADKPSPAAHAECAEGKITIKKRALRNRMKALRAELPDRAERDKRIFDNLFSFPAFARAESVFIYCSLAEEADTRGIICALLEQGKRVYLPRTDGKAMSAVRYAGGALREGRFGVSEPIGEETADKPDVCILPLLAADGQFHRLGYGGGYYDRYFSQGKSGVLKIGICYDFQIADEVPSEEHDVLLDALVTDARILARDLSEVL